MNLDRLALLPILLTFVFYPPVAWIALNCFPARFRIWVLAVVNVVGTLGLCFAETLIDVPDLRSSLVLYVEVTVLLFAAYVAIVLICYAALRAGKEHATRWSVLAFAVPLFFLVLIKYLPLGWNPFSSTLGTIGDRHLAIYFVGISYMAFRLSHLVREVQNKVAPLPGISEYLAFAFFVPTILVGPINPFSKMHSSLQGRGPGREVAPTAWLRLLIGFTKYIFLASIASQFTYDGFLLDGHPHSKMDLAIAVVAYTIYLYCNFSGFCDMVIGVSALLGIEVAENFDRPFTARNLQEFWNRWHMTLSSWLRDFMFTPMLKALVRLFGPASLNVMTALTIISVFVVIGIWHGTGLNYALFGLCQGVGLAAVHYYTVFLKRVLGKQRYLAYQQIPFFRYLGIAMTCAYFSLSLFFFANSLEDMRLILRSLS